MQWYNPSVYTTNDSARTTSALPPTLFPARCSVADNKLHHIFSLLSWFFEILFLSWADDGVFFSRQIRRYHEPRSNFEIGGWGGGGGTIGDSILGELFLTKSL